MPTVLRAGGFAFRIYFEDHESAHVHVWKGGGRAVILLPRREVVATLLRVADLKEVDVARAVLLVEKHAETLWNEWRRIHDSPTH